MKILFALASAEYIRYYDGPIQLLADRGHEVVIAVNHDRGDRKPVKLDGLADNFQRVSVLGVLPANTPFWDRVASGLRGTMDFVRYLDPYFSTAHALRARILRKVVPRRLQGLDRIRSLGRRSTRAVLRMLSILEQGIPTVPALDRFLADVAPDAILVSPLVDAASPQVDLVKSARRLGIPVAAGIASWDNLTNKGLLRVQPDIVIVWNEIQKREAVLLHGVSPERVVVTGAQPFDRWFGRTPSQSAEEFCRKVGFKSATAFVLFTCSSKFVSEDQAEVAFVRNWVRSLRESGHATLAALPVVVRQYPYGGTAWQDADFSDLPNVVVWPRTRFNPVAEENRAGLFDSLYHSVAVVGINTSAMIEAAIVGRPVLSMRASEFAGTQEGTLHFHYLLPENGGFLRVSDNFAEHARQLADVLANPTATAEETRRFVDHFIRPGGRDVAATPAVADALEQLAQTRVAARGPGLALLLRPFMWALAVISVAAVSWDQASHPARKAARLRWHRARKAVDRATRTASANR